MAQGGYMDDVRVKIVEKYKPPPRINLAMSYDQRLILNKQIQDTIPSYEFVLERTVVEKMKEWKAVRQVVFQTVNERAQKAREKGKDSSPEYELESGESPDVSSGFPASPPVLIPTKAFSNILTPIPLKEQTFNSSNNEFKSPEKSPFNISDFEADNYSPFDNMELKSINDMEVLAQVLKSEEPKISQSNYHVPSCGSINYSMLGATNYNYTIPNSTSYIHPSYYASTNGYYYPPETISTNRTFNSAFSYVNQIDNHYSSSPRQEIKSHKSIPDIVKSLEREIENTHIDNRKIEVMPKAKMKSEDSDPDFDSLPKNVQDMSKEISSMGFPLSRVARACKVLGGDQKKVVEHLLAMSDLLNLGFPEARVSSALLQCGNDRDKALDILIS